jgi:hypothetical protein
MYRSGPLAGGPRGGLALALTDNAQLWSVGAVDRGVTTTLGAIQEPYTYGIPAFDVAFRAMLGGANIGDAWFRSHHFLRWNMMTIGDPLYTPYPQTVAVSPTPTQTLNANPNAHAI